MALHPASVEEGDRVLLVLYSASRSWRGPRCRKGHVQSHNRSGQVVIAVGRGTWNRTYASQGVDWAKGWSNPDALLAAFLLDQSARTLA